MRIGFYWQSKIALVIDMGHGIQYENKKWSAVFINTSKIKFYEGKKKIEASQSLITKKKYLEVNIASVTQFVEDCI